TDYGHYIVDPAKLHALSAQRGQLRADDHRHKRAAVTQRECVPWHKNCTRRLYRQLHTEFADDQRGTERDIHGEHNLYKWPQYRRSLLELRGDRRASGSATDTKLPDRRVHYRRNGDFHHIRTARDADWNVHFGAYRIRVRARTIGIRNADDSV